MTFLGFVWGLAEPQEIALWANFALRTALATVFLVSAIGKFLDLPGTRQALADFGVPAFWVRRGAVALCCLELAIAIALLADRSSRMASVWASCLMIGMSLALYRLVYQKRSPPCHCFGAVHSAPVTRATVVRAVLLAGLAAICGFLPVYPIASNPLGFGCVGIGLGLASALAVRKSRTPAPAAETGLTVGQRLPAVRERQGGWIEQGLPSNQQSLLVLTAVDCSACEQLKPALARWTQSFAERLPIRELRAVSEQEPVAPGQLTYEDFAKFRLATPAAILVNRRGVILAPPAVSSEQIEALLRVTLRKLDQAD